VPLPRALARANRVALNRLVRRVAPVAPGLGLLTHRGRRSGREFTIPVNVFAFRGGMRLALTYGPGTDWVRNVCADGGCSLRHGGRTVELRNPRVVHDPDLSGMPPFVRFVLRRIRVQEFLDLDVLDPGRGRPRRGRDRRRRRPATSPP
jgi:deazaflavin-dependent oxidoreductase (nitroreductase family)